MLLFWDSEGFFLPLLACGSHFEAVHEPFSLAAPLLAFLLLGFLDP